jgi:hypothetical protein
MSKKWMYKYYPYTITNPASDLFAGIVVALRRTKAIENLEFATHIHVLASFSLNLTQIVSLTERHNCALAMYVQYVVCNKTCIHGKSELCPVMTLPFALICNSLVHRFRIIFDSSLLKLDPVRYGPVRVTNCGWPDFFSYPVGPAFDRLHASRPASGQV